MLTVLERELLVGLRRGTPFGLLAVNALLLAALAAAVAGLAGTISPWTAPSIGAVSSPAPTGLGPTLVAWRGPVLFFVLAAWLAIVTTVVAPLGGARAITSERAAGTLDALVGSGVSPFSLVIGKAIGAGFQLALVLLSGAPAFAMVWVFGGVSPRVVLLATGLLIAYGGLLVVAGMLLGAMLPGELAPAVVGGAVGGTVLFGALFGFVISLIAGASGLAAVLSLASPLFGLLAANRELTEALAKTIPGLPVLPLHPEAVLLGRVVGGPLPLLSGLFYAALAVTLLSFATVVVDPYHPLKTLRLRRRQP